MNLLLDTHAFLWSAFDPERLPSSVKAALRDPVNQVYVSAVSFWEIALKVAIGKLLLENVTPDQLPAAAENMGFQLLALPPGVAAGFHALPRLKHKDPFDRMLVWMSIQGGYSLVSCDTDLDVYRSHGLRRYWPID
jgi:PIN domain nuclease of toxin-antitoxin system